MTAAIPDGPATEHTNARHIGELFEVGIFDRS
jgi:hypothetical protein